MKIVKIYGGLGNQMFQYAFAKALEHQGEQVLFDLSWFKKSHQRETHRNFDLRCFHVTLPEANRLQTMFSATVKETQANVFEEGLLKVNGRKIYSGYFQSENYFKNMRDILLKDFTLKTKINAQNHAMLQEIKSCEAVSLHVRRGDYLKYPQLGAVCDIAYYRQAADYIQRQVKNPHFYIFSDDIDWVKDNIKLNVPSTYVDLNDFNTAYFDMELMKNCRHNIIANSSFSWWSAWLNPNPDKIVVSPNPWFADGRRTDIIPDHWIKISTAVKHM